MQKTNARSYEWIRGVYRGYKITLSTIYKHRLICYIGIENICVNKYIYYFLIIIKHTSQKICLCYNYYYIIHLLLLYTNVILLCNVS